MRRRWLAALIVILGSLAGSLAAGAAAAASEAPTFKRGATLVEFFEFPKTVGDGDLKTYAEPAFPDPLGALSLFDFDELHRIGFDHMRVPLDVGPLLQADDQERRKILGQLLAVISAINRHGLAVLVTLFPPSLHHELPQTYLDGLDGPKFQAYFAQVQRIAAALRSIDIGRVALEAMNEPQDKCRVLFGTDWTAYQDYMVKRIRGIAPDLPLFLTGGCWSDIRGIVLLDADTIRDPRNFISVHFYYPFLFTHQGAWWTVPFARGTIGVPYPASAGRFEETLARTRARFNAMPSTPDFDPVSAERKAETEIGKYFREGQGPAQIEEWMNQLADWQRRQHVDSDRIVFTEFGAVKQMIEGAEIDRASRARWLRDTSSAIESRGWGWTAYVLRDDPFGLYVHETDRNPDPDLMRALRLDAPKNSAILHQGE